MVRYADPAPSGSKPELSLVLSSIRLSKALAASLIIAVDGYCIFLLQLVRPRHQRLTQFHMRSSAQEAVPPMVSGAGVCY